jgi:expansin
MRLRAAWSSAAVLYAVIGVGTGACDSGDQSTTAGTGAGGASSNGGAPSTGSTGPGATGSGAGTTTTSGPGSTSSSGSTTTSGTSSSGSTTTSSGHTSSTSTSTSTSSSTSTTSSGSTTATCSWDTTSRAGTFTEYYFSQGTAKENNYYKTACGYYGTETTTNGYGSVDQILNIANSGAAKNTYFAAIPGNGTSWPVNDCGACIEFTGSNGTKVIATIIDECPTGSNQPCTEMNHLDLSTSLFGATMVGQGKPNTGGDLGGGSWKFIACPVTGDIMVRFNNGYAGQVYIQNMVYPIKTATANGTALTQSPYGYWSAGSINNLVGTTLVLTDVEGHIVSATVPQASGTGTSLGVQFLAPGTCPL